MIWIRKNEINKVVLTLTENSRLLLPHYLFCFTNEYNLAAEPVWWTSPDLSTTTNRYNLFDLVESEDGSESGGIEVPLKLVSGQWKYKVWEAESQTLDVDLTTGRIIESGRLVVQRNSTIALNENDSVYV